MFYANVRGTDYDFVTKYSRAAGITKQEFLVQALNWQINNPEVPPMVGCNRSKTISIVTPSAELESALATLDTMYRGNYTPARLCLVSVANYIVAGKANGIFKIVVDDIKVPQSIRIILSDEIVRWMKAEYRSPSVAIREAINIAHLLGDLPPLEGSYRKTSGGGKQISISFNAETRDKIRELIKKYGGSPNNIVKQSIEVARSAHEIF